LWTKARLKPLIFIDHADACEYLWIGPQRIALEAQEQRRNRFRFEAVKMRVAPALFALGGAIPHRCGPSAKETWIETNQRFRPDRNANSVSVVGIDDDIVVASSCDD
jgi:hypothetical protein